MFITNLAAKIMFLLYSRKFFFIKILNSLMLIIVTGDCLIIRNRKLKTENRKKYLEILIIIVFLHRFSKDHFRNGRQEGRLLFLSDFHYVNPMYIYDSRQF